MRGAAGGSDRVAQDIAGVASKLNVIVGELAELSIIKTKLLLLGRDTERKTRDQVHEEQDDAGDDERVREAGNAVGKLVAELDVVLVDPAAGDLGGAVEVSNVITVKVSARASDGTGEQDVRSKEAGEHVADNTADAVLSKHIEGLVNAEEELDLGSKVASDGTNNAKDNSRPGRDVTGTGRDGDETSNNAGAETNGAPLPLEAVVEQAPGKATDAGGNVRDQAGHDGAEVGGEGAATVKAEPADPEENGSEDDMGDVVGAVGEAVGLVVAIALSEHQSVGEGSSTGADVNRSATSKVEAAHLEGPAVGVPGPVGNRIVDNGGPDEDEDNGGKHAGAISGSANGEGRAGKIMLVRYLAAFGQGALHT